MGFIRKIIFLLASNCLLLTVFIIPVFAVAGDRDATFDAGSGIGFWGFNGAVNDMEYQSDGKLIVVGDFTTYRGATAIRIARLNSDGSLDDTFVSGTGAGSEVRAVQIQNDDKILIGGSFGSYNSISSPGIARLDVNGAFDATFNVGTGTNDSVYDIAIQDDLNIVIVGSFTNYNGTPTNRIARLTNIGALDLTFNVGFGLNGTTTYAVAIDQDDRIIVGGQFTSYNSNTTYRIARINIDGTYDITFVTGTGLDSVVRDIEVQADGKILIAGYFDTYNTSSTPAIARINTDGSLDTGFVSVFGASNMVMSAKIINENKVLVGGNFGNSVAKLNSDGSLDTSFTSELSTGGSTVFCAVANSNGDVVIGGTFTSTEPMGYSNFIMILANGHINYGDGFNSRVSIIDTQSDGKFIVGGDFTRFNDIEVTQLSRLNLDGSFDNTFNSESRAYNLTALLILKNDKILIATNFNGLFRLNANGSADTSFNPGTGPDGTILQMYEQSDGKVLLHGTFSNYNGSSASRIVRINADGSIDTSFNTGTGLNDIGKMAVQSDGKIIITDRFVTNFNENSVNGIVRINTDGSIDTTLTSTASYASVSPYCVNDVQVSPDGYIYISGSFTAFNGTSANSLIRLLSDGTVDSSFSMGSGFDNTIYALELQQDGDVVVSGSFTTYNGSSQNYLARINDDGSLDTSFTVGSGTLTRESSPFYALFIQSDGNIIAGGGLYTYKNEDVSYLIRILYKDTPYAAIPFVNTSSAQTARISPATRIPTSNAQFSAIYLNQAETNATGYQIQVDNDADFLSTVWDSGQQAISVVANNRTLDLAYTGPTFSLGTTYYWRIRFWDVDSNPTIWSTTQEFLTDRMPTVSDIHINADANVNLTATTTTSVPVVATITDQDGYDDMVGFSGKLYRSGVYNAENCSNNNANCYSLSGCATSLCDETSCQLSCSTDLEFFTDATDTGEYSDEYWRASVNVTDAQSVTGLASSSAGSPEVNSLMAISVSSNIDYGVLTSGTNSGSSNTTVSMINQGNSRINFEVSGTDLCSDFPTCVGATLPVTQQQYQTAGFTYGSGTPLTSSYTEVPMLLEKADQNPSNQTAQTYWGIAIPDNTPALQFSGEININAVANTYLAYAKTYSIAGNLQDIAFGSAVDQFGNTYLGGRFTSASVNFNTTGSGSPDVKSAVGSYDGFLTKLNSDGSYAWTRVVAGSGADAVRRVTVDSTGNIYQVGHFSGSNVDFNTSGNGPADLHSMNGTSGTDVFITKFNQDGSYGWTLTFGGSNGQDVAYGVATDQIGDVYVVGQFAGTNVEFNTTGSGASDLHTASGAYDMFTTKYNSDGSYGWTRTVGGSGSDIDKNVITDSANNVYLVGNFIGTNVEFNTSGSGASDLRSAVSSSDFAMIKYSSAGSYLGAITFNSATLDRGEGVAVDSLGNIYISGWFGDPLGTAVGLAKYDSDLNQLWIRKAVASDLDQVYDIALDANDNVYMAIVLQSNNMNLNFTGSGDPDIFSTTGLNQYGDIILTKINADGSYGWSKQIGGTANDFFYDINIKHNVLYMSGYYSSANVNFNFSGFGPADIRSSVGSEDAFFTKYYLY